MTTKDILREYKQLLAEDHARAEAFFVEHSDDKMFVALVELRREVVPAFIEAGRVLRRESASRIAAYAALVETELVRAWAKSKNGALDPPAYFRSAAENVAPRLEEIHLETCDALLEDIATSEHLPPQL